MIAFKTAVLVGAAMKMGALIAGANTDDAKAIYDFGLFLSTAFQLQDDYLDAFGDPKTFGKQIGGDILEHKKTFLYLKTVELGDKNLKDRFLRLMSDNNADPVTKVSEVKQFYAQSGAKHATSKAVELYTQKAFAVLDTLDLSRERKAVLKEFGQHLMKRKV